MLAGTRSVTIAKRHKTYEDAAAARDGLLQNLSKAGALWQQCLLLHVLPAPAE